MRGLRLPVCRRLHATASTPRRKLSAVVDVARPRRLVERPGLELEPARRSRLAHSRSKWPASRDAQKSTFEAAVRGTSESRVGVRLGVGGGISGYQGRRPLSRQAIDFAKSPKNRGDARWHGCEPGQRPSTAGTQNPWSKLHSVSTRRRARGTPDVTGCRPTDRAWVHHGGRGAKRKTSTSACQAAQPATLGRNRTVSGRQHRLMQPHRTRTRGASGCTCCRQTRRGVHFSTPAEGSARSEHRLRARPSRSSGGSARS